MKENKKFMKEIDFKQYLMWIISFILWITLFNIMQNSHNFISIFLWLVFSAWLINISWIFLYKTLQIKRESPKFIFSFLNIIIFFTIVLTTIFK